MEVRFLFTGKTKDPWVIEGVKHYQKRIKPYAVVSEEVIKEAQRLGPVAIKIDEAKRQLTAIKKSDFIILLDDKGKTQTSEGFAGLLLKWQEQGFRQFSFLIGGAYGVTEEVKNACNYSLSLSALTFPHQLVRLMLVEQTYRAFSILNNEKYHHP
ncbi:MAG: 23S rRNA (pseudouridine(1915)-N(3))-methyltransferase RlmH [SAR324 cluster bacterium]|nr:23S rRNA (pseudouridine(1915)-N(3))-methyltransferase RlmH [SAR324 cluster bacterium]